jgi:hypothetical protein
METKQSNGLPMLDKWEALAVRHCKRNRTKLNILRRIFARRCGLDLKDAKEFHAIAFLVSIVEKFNLSKLSDFVWNCDPHKDEWIEKRVKTFNEAVFDHAVKVLAHTEISKFNNYPRPTLFKNKYPD